MANFAALYVDDEVGDATRRFERTIAGAGFDVRRAYSADEARRVLGQMHLDGEIIDLIVLDRKLPEFSGDRATESIGDKLFTEIEYRFWDTPILVLTGFTDEDFTEMVLQRINSLDLGMTSPVQRVSHFRKGQALKFRETLGEIGEALRGTEDMALEGGVEGRPIRRILKRVGQQFNGTLVRARPATGGSSSAAVWLCDVYSSDGRCLTSVVVKVADRSAKRPAGGFMSSIPAKNAAQPSLLVQGACGGRIGHVAPLAGKNAVSMADIAASSQAGAVAAVGSVMALLDGIPHSNLAQPLREFVSPLIDWERAQEIATEYAVGLPDSTLTVPSHIGCLHGDLHPGNVLIDEDLPIMIDFDSQRTGSLIVDPITLALGAYFNTFGPLRHSPPTLEAVVSAFEGTVETDDWLGAVVSGWSSRGFGERERWAALLAFSLRQLKYEDNRSDSSLRDLAVGLAVHSSRVLNES